MEHIAKLIDEYLQYIIIGSLGLIALAGIQDPRQIIYSIINWGGGTTDNNQPKPLDLEKKGSYFYMALFLLFALGFGLLMDALSYRAFQVAHIQLINSVESTAKSTSESTSPIPPKSLAAQDLPVMSTYALPLLSFMGRSENTEQEKDTYRKHLEKQIKLKMVAKDRYPALFDTLDKSISIAQGVILACIIYFIATLAKLVGSLRAINRNLKLALSQLVCTVVIYFMTFQAYWSLETRYHQIALAAQQNIECSKPENIHSDARQTPTTNPTQH